MRIVAISDTHGKHRDVSLPAGDVLVHTGDLTVDGSEFVIEDFVRWIATQPFTHKIFIAGNHDFWAEQEPRKVQALAHTAGVHYLCDTGVVLDGLHFWGSPYTPKFMDWAFMKSAGSMRKHWQQIPVKTDVLLTHGPPFGVLDEVMIQVETQRLSMPGGMDRHVGCPGLLQRIDQIAVPVHIFGHIHEGYGRHYTDFTRHFNVSQLDNRYRLVNQPVVIDIEHSAGNAASGIEVEEEGTPI